MAKTPVKKNDDIEEIKTLPVSEEVEAPVQKTEEKASTEKKKQTKVAAPLITDGLSHKEKETFYRTIAGKQTRDAVVAVLATEEGVSFSNVPKTRVDEYVLMFNNNVGSFLESKKAVPYGTGDIFNQLQKGKTRKDAMLGFARDNGLSDEEGFSLLNEYTTGGLTKVIERVDTSYTTIIKVEIKTETRLMLEYFRTIGGIVFSGKVLPEDPVTIKVIPENCVFKGCASEPDTEHSSEYTVSQKTSLEELNNEFKNITVKPLSSENVKLSVVVDDGAPREFVFTTVAEAQSDVDTTLDSSTPLTVGEYTKINSLRFLGTIIEKDPVTVRVLPANCKFKGCLSSPEQEHSGEYLFEDQTSLDDLNREFENIQLYPYAKENVSLTISINSRNTRMFCWGDIRDAEVLEG